MNDERVSELEQEIHELRERVSRLEQGIQEIQESAGRLGQSQGYPSHLPQSGFNYQRQPVVVKERRKLSEVSIGKYLLPIVASVLILIGFIILSTIVFAVVQDFVKAFLVFMFAGGCAAVGVVLGRKQGKAVFKTALVSLSLTLVFVNIVLMTWVWSLLSMVAAIVLVVCWCLLCAWLGYREKNRVFHYVALTGVTIVSLLSLVLFDYDIGGLILELSIIFMTAALLLSFIVIHKTGSPLIGIAGLVIMVTLSCMVRTIGDTGFLCRTILFGAIVLYALAYKWFAANSSTFGSVVLAVNAFVIPFVVLATHTVETVVFECLATVLICACFSFHKETRNVAAGAGFLVYLMAWAGLFEQSNKEIIGISLCLLTICAAYFMLEDRVFDVLLIVNSAILVVWSAFLFWTENIGSEFIAGLVAMIVVKVMALCERDRIGVTIGLFGLSPILYFRIMSLQWDMPGGGDTNTAIVLLVLFTILIAVTKTVEAIWEETYYRDLQIFAWALNALALESCASVDSRMQLVIACAVLLSVVPMLVYLYNLLAESDARLEIILAVTFTTSVTAILSRTPLWEVRILVSVLLMVLAACYTWIGFNWRRKSLRLFSLVLLFVCVAKMLLFDMSGQGTIIRVLSLIGGGVVCLGISYLYNGLEKKLSEGVSDKHNA